MGSRSPQDALWAWVIFSTPSGDAHTTLLVLTQQPAPSTFLPQVNWSISLGVNYTLYLTMLASWWSPLSWWDQFPVWEDPTCCGTTEPECHNPRACLQGPGATATDACAPRARALQQEKPLEWEAHCPRWLQKTPCRQKRGASDHPQHTCESHCRWHVRLL